MGDTIVIRNGNDSKAGHGPGMIRNLTRHGSRYAPVIQKPVFELLRVSRETPFEILTDGQCLVLSPVREPEDEKTFQATQEIVHKRFGRAMKRLAS